MSATLHVLYRFYDQSDQLLYIGITGNPPSRFSDHQNTRPWWRQVATIRLAHCTSRQDLMHAEREAIRMETPLFNVAGAGTGAKEFQEDFLAGCRSDLFIDEMFAAVAATGIRDTAEAIKEYRRQARAS